jgi:glycosyltransferase involved in cell wall biosynthesis
VDAMAEAGLQLLDDARWAEASAAARQQATRFSADTIVPMYEAYYERVLAG